MKMYDIPTGPIGLSNWIEAANFLATRVILDEAHIAGDIDLAFLFGNLLFLFGDRLRTEAAAIMNNVLSLAKECRVAMKINFTILGLIPLSVQEQILGIEKLFNLPRVEVSTVRDSLSRSQ
jgi:hypothetical protein